MKKYNRWISATFLGLLSVLVANMSFGQSPGIFPVDPGSLQPKTNSLVKLHLINSAGADVTGTWLPDLSVPVKIVVEGPANYALSMVPPIVADPVASRILATSAYPGSCTNFGTELTPDFDFDSTTKTLTPFDFGGMAVIKVTPSSGGSPEFFVIPQDSDFDGIADIYERQSCGTDTCLAADGDIDTGPEVLSPIGDFIANIDEYRGFRVKGAYVRGNPNVKNVFLQFLESPQCVSEATLREGDSTTPLISLASFYKTATGSVDYSGLFTAANTLMPNLIIHYIDKTEWVDYFASYSTSTDVTLSGTAPENAIRDRQINLNALIPMGRSHPSDQNIRITKGVRLVQCLKTSGTDLGVTRKFPPDGSPEISKNDGTAVIFPQRIWTYFKNKFVAGGARRLKYLVYDGSAWVDKTDPAWPAPVPSFTSTTTLTVFLGHPGVNFIMKQAAFPFYAAHEALGHGLDLTSTIDTSYGYHHADGAGTNIDVKIVSSVDKKTTGYNWFSIPKNFARPDKEDMRFSLDQVLQ